MKMPGRKTAYQRQSICLTGFTCRLDTKQEGIIERTATNIFQTEAQRKNLNQEDSKS